MADGDQELSEEELGNSQNRKKIICMVAKSGSRRRTAKASAAANSAVSSADQALHDESIAGSPVSLGSSGAALADDTARNSAASSGSLSNTSSPSPLDAPSNTSTELDPPDVVEDAGQVMSGPLFEGMKFEEHVVADTETAADNNDSASHDHGEPFTATVEEVNDVQDLEKRNRAFEAFKKLEDHYQKLFAKVMEEKERDLDRVEQSVGDGSHKNLIASLRNLEESRLKALQVAESRKNLEMQSIAAEYDDAKKRYANSFVNQRDSLRKYLMHKLNSIRHELEQESHHKEKAPVGRRIKMNPQAFHPSQKVRTVPYPVLEQYHWRRRQHYRILTTHATTTDERGDLVFPSFKPASLQPTETEQDLSFIRAGTKTLNQLAGVNEELDKSSPAGDVQEVQGDVDMIDAGAVVEDSNKENVPTVPSLKLTLKLPSLAR